MEIMAILALLFLGVVIFIVTFQVLYIAKKNKKSRRDAANLSDIIKLLDKVTLKLNKLSGSVTYAQNHETLLDYFEATLKVHEQLLTVMKKLLESEVSQISLDSANYLSNDLDDRVERLAVAFEQVKRSGRFNLGQLMGRPTSKLKKKACYFCSRPLSSGTKNITTVKKGSDSRKVLACPVCLIAIEQEGSAKVLHFSEKDKEIHWSEYKDFLPNHNYWNINKLDDKNNKPRLTLVKSEDNKAGGKSRD